MSQIKNIQARYILDSRGNPTVEADVILSNGIIGRAAVPSGASTGDKEALELRDKKPEWGGKGVQKAIDNIDLYIKPALQDCAIADIPKIDSIMLNIDGTTNKSKLGSNAILAVSLASVQAHANNENCLLYEIIQEYYNNPTSLYSMPIPMMNIINGGSHADNTVDIQEFMIMPINFTNYKDALRAGTEIFHSLKRILKTYNYSTAIGDEGGFAPNLRSNEEAIECILEAIHAANYSPGKDIYLALDVAASEFYNTTNKTYVLESDNKQLDAIQLINYYKKLCEDYPIISIEDGLDQNDWESWSLLNNSLGDSVQIVGDDLTVTNPKLLQNAIDCQAINSILIKLNQIGTFTETLQTIELAQENGLGTIISHRSGETENTFIADLAVATNAGQIKTGSLCRTDRTAKYNRLLRIEEHHNLCTANTNNKIKYANRKYLGCEKRNK